MGVAELAAATPTRSTRLDFTSSLVLGIAVQEGWPVEAILPQRKPPGSPDECVEELVKNYALRCRGLA